MELVLEVEVLTVIVKVLLIVLSVNSRPLAFAGGFAHVVESLAHRTTSRKAIAQVA